MRVEDSESTHQALGYRTPREVFERRGLPAGKADDTAETIAAQQEPERRCFRDADLIPIPVV